MQRYGIVTLIALAACGGGSQAGELVPEPRQSCSGNSFVSVINDWNRAVEVYSVTGEGGTGALLGIAHAGSASEFLLPRDAVGASVATSGLSGPVAIPSRARSLVRLRYVCR